MQTASGLELTFSRLDHEAISIADIAHHLAQVNRFNGAAKFPYSVAQHSVLMWNQALRDKVSPECRLDCLLHDAHEAYVNDMIAPLGWHLEAHYGDYGYKELKRKIDSLIREKFGIGPQSDYCKNLDLWMLCTERKQLMPYGGTRWEVIEDYEPMDITIVYWPWAAARTNYEDMLRNELRLHGYKEYFK